MTDMEINSRRGKCYQLSADYVVDNENGQSLTLCHGWPILTAGPHRGSRYGHAWVERKCKHSGRVECWDSVHDKWFDALPFYVAGRIEWDKVVRYSFEDVLDKILSADATYGPWVEEPYDGAL